MIQKQAWWKLLKSILKSGNSPTDKYFRAWTEGGDKVLFACDTRRAIMIRNHGLNITEDGVYTIFGNDIVKCSSTDETKKVEDRNHHRVMNQGEGITIVEGVRVPQLKCSGRDIVPVSIPMDETEPWVVGHRPGRPSMNANYLPLIRDWDEVRIANPNNPVLFHTVVGDVVVDYLVMPMTDPEAPNATA